MSPIALPLLLAAFAASAQSDSPAQLRQRAGALVAQGKYEQAESLLNLALDVQEKATGPEDLSLTAPLGELAALYRAEGRTAQAIFGYPDYLKFRSSMTLFACAAAGGGEPFGEALAKYFNVEDDPLTRELLNHPG